MEKIIIRKEVTKEDLIQRKIELEKRENEASLRNMDGFKITGYISGVTYDFLKNCNSKDYVNHVLSRYECITSECCEEISLSYSEDGFKLYKGKNLCLQMTYDEVEKYRQIGYKILPTLVDNCLKY